MSNPLGMSGDAQLWSRPVTVLCRSLSHSAAGRLFMLFVLFAGLSA